MIVVCDASPIIGLSSVRQLDLLRQLYTEIVIPESVAREIVAGWGRSGFEDVLRSDWIKIKTVGDSVLRRALGGELDSGEAEAIALAVEVKAEILLIDERRARKVAQRLGIAVVGVLGVLLEAKTREFIPAVRPLLENLLKDAGFRIHPDLYQRVLEAAGER
ncbi:MAG: DUF3368 domain-containing protein [Thermoanaerobaculia bacterium]